MPTDSATRRAPASASGTRAEIRLPSADPQGDLAFYMGTLGMRLETIFPADDPRVAVVAGHGLRLRLERGAPEDPGTIRIETDDPAFAGGARSLTAPNGTRVEIAPLSPPLVIPKPETAFMTRHLRDGAPWVIGRAGMNYRDLIPTRLGGTIIASHIRIPGGGEVPDMVHYHTVGFQLIFCYRGWVEVLYEDQGDDVIRLEAGDCVTQPPEIRHRVCRASPDIEVIEIGVPAEHITTIDHEMTLPNGRGDPAREWQGQRFVHHVRARARWQDFRVPGFTCRDTGVAAGTKDVAGVQVARYRGGTPPRLRHDAEILFDFVMEGSMRIEVDGHAPQRLEAGDAFVTPPGLGCRWSDCSDDLELLEVSLPGRFTTEPA